MQKRASSLTCDMAIPSTDPVPRLARHKKWLTRCATAVALILIALLAILHQLHAPLIPIGKPLPPGKVKPQLACKYNMALLLAPDGSLWAWGDGLQNVFPPGASLQVPQRVDADSDWSRVAVSRTHIVALKQNGSLWAWGLNRKRQVGPGYMSTNVFKPTRIGVETNWSQIWAGDQKSLALKTDGSLWRWDYNGSGQLGDGRTNDSAVPTMIGTNRDWRMITSSPMTSYALKTNGTLWDLGGGYETVPRQISSDTNWITCSADVFAFLAQKSDGTLWDHGLMQIGRDQDWTEIYPSFDSFFACKKDGSWWGQGHDKTGQFGLGTNEFNFSSPQRLPFTFEPWAFGPNGDTTLLLCKDGKLWTWGRRLGWGTKPAPSALRRRLDSLLKPVVARIPSLGSLIESNFDQTPHLLWELPLKVRRSLGSEPKQ